MFDNTLCTCLQFFSELSVVLWGLGLQILQISHFAFSDIKVTPPRVVRCRPCQICCSRRQI